VIAKAIRRGLAAGLVAGLLAGVVALVVGEPALEEAIALEGGEGGFPRGLQLIGLPIGTALVGLGVGAIFAVASVWAVGRVEGDALRRSLKLGAAAVYAVVGLPALKYPPNPPTVGDPATVSSRNTLYLGLVVLGLVLVAAAWAAGRQLAATGLSPAARTAIVGAGLAVATVAVLAILPDAEAVTGPVSPALLTSFRVRSVAVQAVLYGGTALAFGLLARRSEAAVR
jgi:Probable cobalt transporter subunit (CbtA)